MDEPVVCFQEILGYTNFSFYVPAFLFAVKHFVLFFLNGVLEIHFFVNNETSILGDFLSYFVFSSVVDFYI